MDNKELVAKTTETNLSCGGKGCHKLGAWDAHATKQYDFMVAANDDVYLKVA